MKLKIVSVLVLLLTLFTNCFSVQTSAADTGSFTYITPLNSEQNFAQISVSVTNFDSPNAPITEGTRIKVLAYCLGNPSLLPRSTSYPNGYTAYWTSWSIRCALQFKQKDTFGRTFEWDQARESFDIYPNNTAAASFKLIDEVYKLTSSETVRISWDAGLNVNEGSRSDAEINRDSSGSDVVIFTPSSKSTLSSGSNVPKTSSNQTTQTLDGEELDAEEDPSMKISRDSKGGFIFNLIDFPANSEVTLIAKKKGSKSLRFINTIDSNGALKFRTNRNLKGFKVSAIVDDEQILLYSVK